jgi:hypothetical protein
MNPALFHSTVNATDCVSVDASDTAGPRQVSDPVAELIELLGNPVVFIRCPKGKKRPFRKWAGLTVEDMTPKYLAKLPTGNIGVALGERSGGLVALDVDLDEMVEPFVKANPFLNKTLQTRASRGRVFWFRMVGDYPRVTQMLKTQSGGDCGEWRAGKNAMSIVHGIHPNGNPYQFVHRAKAISVEFANIVWPREIINAPSIETQLAGTEDTDDTKDTEDTDEVNGWLYSVHSIEDALRVSTPTGPRQNYKSALILARAVKALEAQSGQRFTPEQHQNIHKQWLACAARFLRLGQSNGDYFIEYLNAYRLAKYPLGSMVLAQVIEAAKRNPLSPDALPWIDDLDLRFLAAICRELQNMAGDKEFYLGARTVQKIFKHEKHDKGAKWLRVLCVMKVIKEIEKGRGNRASRYRYIYQLNEKG